MIFVRFDQDQRKDLSTVTSVIVATITPFVLSDQAHIYQRRDVNTDLSLNDSNNNHRRKLASRLSMVMSSMLFISNFCLFYSLKYNENFTHYDDITIQRHNAERILSNFSCRRGALPWRLVIFTVKKLMQQNYPKANEN